MHDVETVHVVQGKHELLDHVGGLRFRELLLLLNHVEQVAPCDELHDDVVAPGIFHELKNARDMRMNRLLKDLELVFVELLVDVGHLKRSLVDNFDGAEDA